MQTEKLVDYLAGRGKPAKLDRECVRGALVLPVFRAPGVSAGSVGSEQRDRSAVKSACCFSRRLEFGSQNRQLVTHSCL